jgi:hypothetical protein
MSNLEKALFPEDDFAFELIKEFVDKLSIQFTGSTNISR